MRQPLSSRVILMRKSLALMMLVCLVVVYVIWTSDDLVECVEAPEPPINDSSFVCNESPDDYRGWLVALSAMSANSNHGSKPPAPPSAQTTTTTEAPPKYVTPTIYFVTPTYPRREQIAELTRLGQTLMLVPNLHWIVADDFEGCNRHLSLLLQRFGMPYTHLASPMHEAYRQQSPIPRGVANRRAAIAWIREFGRRPGVLYFGDDDNTFDLRLFGELRDTRKVSMFPVGLIGLYAVSSPVVVEGKVIGFYDSWPAKRQWPVDMAGFAINLDYLANSPNATMPYRAGYEEDEFLQSIGLQLDDIEPRAGNCTEVLVWHTQTKNENTVQVRMSEAARKRADATSLGLLLQELEGLGVGHVSAASGILGQLSRDGKSKPVEKW